MSLLFSKFSAGLFGMVLVAALLGQPVQDKKDQKETPASTLPPATPDPGGSRLGATAAVDPKTYVIEPEDVVAIKVWREEPLSGLFTVRPDGKITMHLVGDIQAGGLTPDQLQTRVVEALQTVINRPQVVAAVHEVRSKKYFVSGEVNRPGEYRLQSKVTVMEALSMAGGFREFANTKGIKIMRGNERLKFNYNDVVKGKKLEQNIELKKNDHIVVP